jgi:hypothetical protein
METGGQGGDLVAVAHPDIEQAVTRVVAAILQTFQ